MPWRRLRWALMATSAQAQKQYGPGASDTEIRIGNTAPYSGPASAYSAGAVSEAAYFKMINDQGGVNGRKINFISLDDAYSPPKTVEQIRRLDRKRRGAVSRQPGRHGPQHCRRQIHQPEKGAASVRRLRRDGVQRSRELSVDHELDAALCVGRRDLRQIYPVDQTRRQDRDPVAERRSRPRLPDRIQEGARRQARRP